MTLRGDGVVEGEIKGQIFSLGEEELVRGEMGFEVVSDPDDDDECVGINFGKLFILTGSCSILSESIAAIFYYYSPSFFFIA